MQTRIVTKSRLVFAALGCLAAGPAVSAAQFTKPYHIVDLSDDIFAVVWDDIRSFPAEGNHLVILNEDHVVVVDANRTPSLTDTVIGIIRARTTHPVRYVVNTHWHADHVQGNSVYQREFPGVAIIGHPATTAGIDTIVAPYVVEVRADLARVRHQLEGDTTDGGGALSDDERTRLDAQRRRLEREVTLYDVVVLAHPTLVVADSVALEHGIRRIEILHFGHGNTKGDLVVWLPHERIMAVGDLVTEPWPLIGYDSPTGWHQALERVLERRPRLVVPGHGEVLVSTEYVELYRDFFRELTTQVQAGVEAGRSLEELQQGVELGRFWRAFAGENERLLQLFAQQYQPAAVERAYRELRSP